METERLALYSLDIEQTDKDKLKSVFPQCFVEGKLDIDMLLNLCGEYITNDFEKYKFEWKGKGEAIQLAGKRSAGTLRPCRDESVDFDNTKNIYIEGDNLEVLKLLQTSYFGKVKMIYIDPPYNTGSDFVYADDFKDPLERYREVTKQTTKSNPESMGRFHTNWLNMMWPRLRLAANLLRDDGVIFISIDDHEVHNLRKICDEIFGEENCIGTIIQNKLNSKNDTVNIQRNHEYILAYRKSALYENATKISPTIFSSSSKIRDVFEENGEYFYINDSITTRGEGGVLSARPNLGYSVYYNSQTGDKIAVADYDISKAKTAKDYDEIYTTRQDLIEQGYIAIRPPKVRGNLGVWTWELTKFNNEKKNIIITGKPDNYAVKKRTFIEKDKVKIIKGKMTYNDTSVSNVRSIWDFSTNDGTSVFNEVMETEAGFFNNPKNIDMIKKLISVVPDNDFIVLDFFSGSATTAHAVMQLNAEDGGNRRFILVQLPEVTDEKSEAYKAGYKNICEIGKERIRRAGEKLAYSVTIEGEITHKEEWIGEEGRQRTFEFLNAIVTEIDDDGDTLEKMQSITKTLIEEEGVHYRIERKNNRIHERFGGEPLCDTGFRVFKLDSSNINLWNSDPIPNDECGEEILLNRLLNHLDILKKDRTPEDVTFEVMLKLGQDLCTPITPLDIGGKTVYGVGEDITFIVCLAENVTLDEVKEMADYAPGRIVFADRCFTTTEEKANVRLTLRDKGITIKTL